MLNKHISNLIRIAIEKEFIQNEDKYYVANKIISLLGETEFELIDYTDNHIASINFIMDYAVDKKLVGDTIVQRDLFESKIMDNFVPLPSTVNNKIKSFNTESEGIDWLFEMNKFSNYIKTERTGKNIEFSKVVDGVELDITINNSKPEKTPADIAAAMKIVASSYPETILSKDNVGFAGNSAKQPRTNHRIFPMELNGEKWYFQHSPYQYFNKHAIILTDKIVPMNITGETYKAMLQFIESNEEYKVGANADIPIVGGSILYHNHYQAGVNVFPIEKSKEEQIVTIGNVKVSFTDWLVGSVVLEGSDIEEVSKIGGLITKYWKEYESKTELLPNDGTNNTVSSFAKKINGNYKLYLLFRNNGTSAERPDGIYHVPYHLQAIKGENIGIIEAIGVAILPGRLKKELENLGEQTGEKWSIWKKWIGERIDMNNFDQNEAIARTFHEILKEVSVFNKAQEIKEDIEKFIKSI